ncbi:hypothetical protein ACFU1R_05895 [Priestia megaterium]|uniref:hypothetical protein n=1 Tax=Priestia megaterium TaxID=1404 RepID=UPI00366F12FF
MEYKFVACLFNMELENQKNRGISIFPGGRISNGQKMLKAILDTQPMQDSLGFHSLHEFEDTVYAYAEGVLEDIVTKEQMDEMGMSYTFYLLREFESFLEEMWKVKDNNVYIRDGFILASDDGFKTAWTYKASLSTIYTASSGRKGTTLFTDEEIKLAKGDFTVGSFEDWDEEDEGGKNVSSDVFFRGKGSNRMLRARYFTAVARGSATIPKKIVHYCNALECLFTTSKTEVVHNIAERVSFMLADDEESQKELFRFIKKAYDHRSYVVHGQSLRGTEERLIQVSIRLDDILRSLICSNDEVFKKVDKEMDSYFNDLVSTKAYN